MPPGLPPGPPGTESPLQAQQEPQERPGLRRAPRVPPGRLGPLARQEWLQERLARAPGLLVRPQVRQGPLRVSTSGSPLGGLLRALKRKFNLRIDLLDELPHGIRRCVFTETSVQRYNFPPNSLCPLLE